MGEVDERFLELLKMNPFIIGRNGYVVRWGFVGPVGCQSILMTLNLLIQVQFTIFTHQSFTQYIAFN